MNKKLKYFNQFFPLNEDVNAAKSLLLKIAARKYKKSAGGEPKKFTPDEEKKILSNPDYIELRDYLLNIIKKPGLVYAFTYFMFEEGLPRYTKKGPNGEYDEKDFTVENLINLYLRAASNFNFSPLPLETINNYIKDKEIKKSTTPAYETLFADLESVLSMKGLKEFVDKIQSKGVRSEFKKAVDFRGKDPEYEKLLDTLYNSYLTFKNLPPIIDRKGVPITPEEEIIKKSKKYLDEYNLYQFKNDKERFEMFVADCKQKAEGWGSGIDDFLIDLDSIAPSIKVLYLDYVEKIVVTSARSAEGMRSVCKISNADLCIQSDSNFWSITGGCLQISINMLGLNKDDLKYLTSFTIKPNGSIKESRTRVNMKAPQPSNPGESWDRFIKRYFSELDTEKINEAISKNFNSEITIKNIIESIEKKSGGNKMSLLGALGSLGIQKAIEEGDYTQEEMNIYRDLIVTIIKKDNKIGYDDMVKFFLGEGGGGGFYLKEDIELFEIMSDYKYNKEDVRKILDITIMSIPQLESFLKSLEGRDEKLYVRVKYVIDYHPTIREYVETKML